MSDGPDESRCPRCGTAYPSGRLAACPRCLLEGELPPVVLDGRLALEEEIGRGGMGTVFRSQHLGLGRTVAVKLLTEELAAEPEFQQRFAREARALALLEHPHIVGVFDFGQDADQSYLVMEYVRGGSLADRMPLPPAIAIELALQVCDAVSYAHRQGMVHRDIKPENILIDTEGRAKVADFGLARLVGKDGERWTVTAPDMAVGTPHYMAPEVLSGAPPSPQMDIYSLGVLVYQMFTGELPIGRFDPPPAPLDGILERALARDPLRRYQDVDTLADDLRRASDQLDRLGSELTEVVARAPAAPATSPPNVSDLPIDEVVWLRSVALLMTVASACLILAIFLCMIPRRYPAGTELDPLTHPRTVIDQATGEIVSSSRFETVPVLAALGVCVLALAAYGFIRRHWRLTGLDRPTPDVPVAESRFVLACGLASLALYALKHAVLQPLGLEVIIEYLNIPGGLILTGLLFCAWVAILQAWRTGRSLLRERRIWIGLVVGLIPPVSLFLDYVSRSR